MRLLILLAVFLSAGCSSGAGKGSRLSPRLAPDAGPLHLDLAVLPVDSISVPLLAGNYRIQIANLAPANTYSITVALEALSVAPLEITSQVREQRIAGIRDEVCPDLQGALDRLSATSNEAGVPAIIRETETAIRGCNDESLKVEARRRIAGTRRDLGPFTVQRGQVLAVQVTRAGTPPRKWTRVFSSGSRGSWRQTYGFNFIWNEFAPNRHHFVEEGATQGTYVIRGRRSQDHFELAPSLFYTWMPGDKELDNLVFSPTVGLGFDFQAPVVSVGGAWTYNQNATLSAGLSLHRVQRLNERYSVGEVVNSLLSEQDLQRGVYRVNPYIAVTIRSLTNPFQRNTTESP